MIKIKKVRFVSLMIITIMIKISFALEWRKLADVQNFHYFDFSTSQVGWAIDRSTGGGTFETKDGGKTWNKIPYPATSISFWKDRHRWILNKDTIYYSSDGGIKWDSFLVELKNLKSIYFLTETYGVANDDSCRMYWSNDGGKTWNKAQMDTNNMVGVFSTHFIDSLNGWFAGWSASYWDAGSILRTNDGGKSWKTVLLTYMLNHIYCIDSLNSFAAGFDWISKQGLLLITNDGWKKYKEIRFDSLTSLDKVVFLNLQTGLVIGPNSKRENEVWETNDSGKTWKKVENIGTALNIGRSNNALFISSIGKLFKCEITTGILTDGYQIRFDIKRNSTPTIKQVIVNNNHSMFFNSNFNLLGKTASPKVNLSSGCYLLKDKE